MKNILAIDPGASGGFAWRDILGKVHTLKMPDTEGDVVSFIRSRACDGCTVVLEQVGGFIQGNPAPGSTMFNFGEGFGIIKGATQALGVPLVMVRPQAWQKALSLGNKKDYDKRWKPHLKEVAQRLYPSIDITLKTADAILILHYAEKYLS